MSVIPEIEHPTDIPYEIPRPSYEEMDVLLREMKPLMAANFERHEHRYSVWFKAFIYKLGYSQLGDWFYDSLIAVNRILWRESQGIPRSLFEPALQLHASYTTAATLAHLYGDCYRYRNTGGYIYRLRASFWLDRGKEWERESTGYDLMEMVSAYNDTWPKVVHGFGLFPSLFDKRAAPSLRKALYDGEAEV